MAAAAGGKVFIRSGGGIVADSIPKEEFEETVNKSKAMMEAITMAQEVKDYDFAD